MNNDDLFTKVQDANETSEYSQNEEDIKAMFVANSEAMSNYLSTLTDWHIQGFFHPLKPEYSRIISNPDTLYTTGCQCPCCIKE